MHLITNTLFISHVLVVLLEYIAIAEAYECPDPDDIIPCECSDFGRYPVISCSDDRKDSSVKELRNVLKHLSGTPSLELQLFNYRIGIVPSKLFEGVDIRKLLFSETEIHSFEDDSPIFSGLESKLQTLKIYRCIREPYIYNFTWKLDHLRKLQRFEFRSNCDLQYNSKHWKISNDWFANGPILLKIVDLENNDIESLADRAFAGLVSLRELKASGNNIKVIKRNMFPDPANKLVKLDFSHNKIESLPDDIFSNMPSLEEVSFYNNNLETLSEHVWSAIWEQLEDVSLGDHLTCDSSINWVFTMRRPYELSGKCSAHSGDTDKRGNYLSSLIDKKIITLT